MALTNGEPYLYCLSAGGFSVKFFVIKYHIIRQISIPDENTNHKCTGRIDSKNAR